MITREALLQFDDRPTRVVTVSAWDGAQLRIRVLSAKQMDGLSAGTDDGDGNQGYLARLIIAAVVNDEGEPLFLAEDEPALLGKSYKVLEELAGEIMDLSGMTRAAEKELEGNSEETAGAVSSSE